MPPTDLGSSRGAVRHCELVMWDGSAVSIFVMFVDDVCCWRLLVVWVVSCEVVVCKFIINN